MNFIYLKKKLHKSFFSISLFFLGKALRFNNHTLCAFLLRMNITHFNKIKLTNKKQKIKKILVFPKSGGCEDLVESFRNDSKNNIIFFLLPRIFLKKIFHFHFKNTNKSKYHSDYYTKPQNGIEMIKKKRNVEFLTKTFFILTKFFKLDGFISFNLFYYNEKYLEEVCQNLNIKYIVLHKESVFSPYEEKHMTKLYQNNNDKSLAYKISVYSNNQKKIMIQSKIATKEQLTVNGCPRSDYAFRLRKIKPKRKMIIFYLIEYERGNNKRINIDISYKKLFDKTLSYLKEFAINHPNIEIILKGKTGVHLKKNYSDQYYPKNCIFIAGGAGEKLLKNASVVIAFNSTIVFETIASNRNLIIPNFHNEYKYKKKFLHKVFTKKYFADSKNQFNKKIVFYLNTKYKNNQMTNSEKKVLSHYLGNTDGKSGKRMRKFLKNILRKN